jgi:AraC family transcriptional regulator
MSLVETETRSNPLARALARIDANLFDPLTLAELAGAAGLSPFHFSRLFAAAMGESVIGYVRRRRLVEAARRLRQPDPPRLIDLALDCGFQSQEAFTRAFKRAFHMTPARFQRDRSHIPRSLEVLMTLLDAKPIALEQLPGFSRRPAFTVVGLATQCDSESAHKIPGLWRRLFEFGPIAGRIGEETFGVCCNAGEEGVINYMAAVEFDPAKPTPEGLERMDLAAQAYAVFRLTLNSDPLHPQMQAAARDIWMNRVPASELTLVKAPDFEMYAPGFEERAGDVVDFCLPVDA